MTPQENRLWVQLRQMRADGFHFRRRAPLLGFYLDFVCFSRRLIVEVDGSQHAEDRQADHDAMRDAILRRAGFHTIRVWNSDIDTNLDGVIRLIQYNLQPSSLSSRGWPSVARSGEEAGRVSDVLQAQRTAPDSPTRPPLRGVHPPHEGEGRGAED